MENEMSNKHCPCGSTLDFNACCGRLIQQGISAQNAEQLMRSRYTAYTLADAQYLLKTWHPDHRPELDIDELNKMQWLRLEVVNTKLGLKKSIVEFNAYYLEEEVEQCLHEVSEFKKIKNRWYYTQPTP
jgi:SEC-C motif-containing protein